MERLAGHFYPRREADYHSPGGAVSDACVPAFSPADSLREAAHPHVAAGVELVVPKPVRDFGLGGGESSKLLNMPPTPSFEEGGSVESLERGPISLEFQFIEFINAGEYPLAWIPYLRQTFMETALAAREPLEMSHCNEGFSEYPRNDSRTRKYHSNKKQFNKRVHDALDGKLAVNDLNGRELDRYYDLKKKYKREHVAEAISAPGRERHRFTHGQHFASHQGINPATLVATDRVRSDVIRGERFDSSSFYDLTSLPRTAPPAYH